MHNKSLYESIFQSQLLFVAVASASTQAAAILSGIQISQNLGAEDYGRYILIQSSIQAFLIVASFGNLNTVTRYTAIYRDRNQIVLNKSRQIIKLINTITVLMSFLLLALYIQYYYYRSPSTVDMGYLLWAASPSLLFLTFDLYYKGILIAEQKNKALAFTSIFSASFLFIGTLVATKYGNIEITVYVVTLSTALQCYLSRRYTGARIKTSPNNQLQTSQLAKAMILKYSLPTMLAGATVQPVHWIMQNWLSIQDNSYQQVAIFGICIQWLAIVMFLPSQLSKVLLPRFSEADFSKKYYELKILMRKSIAMTSLYGLSAAGALVVLAPLIASYYGSLEQQLTFCLRVTAIAAFLSILQSPLGSYLNSKENVWNSFAINFIWAISYVAAAFYLKNEGAAGFLLAMSVAYVVTLLLILIWLAKSLKAQNMHLIFTTVKPSEDLHL